ARVFGSKGQMQRIGAVLALQFGKTPGEARIEGARDGCVGGGRHALGEFARITAIELAHHQSQTRHAVVQMRFGDLVDFGLGEIGQGEGAFGGRTIPVGRRVRRAGAQQRRERQRPQTAVARCPPFSVRVHTPSSSYSRRSSGGCAACPACTLLAARASLSQRPPFCIVRGFCRSKSFTCCLPSSSASPTNFPSNRNKSPPPWRSSTKAPPCPSSRAIARK